MYSLFRKIILVLVFYCIVFSLTSYADENDKVNQLIEAAKTAQQQAASVGGEWRDVGKMLEQAEHAANSGNLEKAKQLAELVKLQSELGYQQAVEQKGNVKHPSILR